VLAVAECAALALPHIPDGEERPRRAVELTRRYGRGERVSPDELRAASDAAAYATYAASDYAASPADAAAFATAAARIAVASCAASSYAAYAASCAATAATAADDASFAASFAVSTASSAVSAATARKDTLKRCAAIVRRIVDRETLFARLFGSIDKPKKRRKKP